MTRMSAMSRGYIMGVVFASLARGFHQDYIGLEAYIAYARKAWIDLPWWPWLFGIVLLCGIIVSQIRKARREDARSK